MEKREKLDLMEKMLRELEDIKNSETSVLKKIGQLEAENINASINLIDQNLGNIFEKSDENISQIDELLEKFKAYRDKFVKDNKLDEVVTEA